MQKVDQKDFLVLVTQHKAMLHKVCNLYADNDHDEEDLFQEIVVQLWKSYPTFRGGSKFSTWLYRVALNTAIAGIRKHKTYITYLDPQQFPTQIHDKAEHKENEERLGQLYAAINLLSHIEKAVVMLYLDDKTYEEMEEILGINQNNLRVKMNRIKDKLRKLTKAS